MRVMTKVGPAKGKVDAIAILSQMQTSLRGWLALPPALEQPVSWRIWRAQLYEAARHARSAGLHAYSSVSVRIGEQLEPSFRSNDMPRSAVQLLSRWSQASLRYLRHNTDFESAAELVSLLRMSCSDYYGAEERSYLLRNLNEDHERDAQLCARQQQSSRSAGTA